MSLLARYGLQREYRQEFETLSGGQKARLEILWLEVEGSNLLLLDEPTDHLDIDSSEALEAALDTFVGTVLAVSHDRAFLARLDRFLMLMSNGDVYALPDFDTALEALQAPGTTPRVKLARRLTLG
jgi:ATPase subunit of ABC transporter with duplicated ATPase domains